MIDYSAFKWLFELDADLGPAWSPAKDRTSVSRESSSGSALTHMKSREHKFTH